MSKIVTINANTKESMGSMGHCQESESELSEYYPNIPIAAGVYSRTGWGVFPHLWHIFGEHSG